MKWLGSLLFWIGIEIGCLPSGYAEVYEGRIIREVQVSCISSEELVKRVWENIPIQPGDVFSQENIRASIRQLYTLK
ncbi:MAG: hypothetical protein GY801_06120, partial [bacterium]|nr:hypothetical protein [bacterium]